MWIMFEWYTYDILLVLKGGSGGEVGWCEGVGHGIEEESER